MTIFVSTIVFLLAFAAVLMTAMATVGLIIGFTTLVKPEDKVSNLTGCFVAYTIGYALTIAASLLMKLVE